MLTKLFEYFASFNLASTNISETANKFVSSITTNLGPSIVNIIVALAILLLGLFFAAIVAVNARSLLKRIRLDDRIAGKFRSNSNQLEIFKLEKWIPIGLFSIIFGISLIACLETLKLRQFTKPINVLLKNISSYLPNLLGAAILLFLAWLIAKTVKFAAARSLNLLRVDELVNSQIGDSTQQNQLSLSNAIPRALYWFIFLFFLPIILDALGLQSTLEPVQKLLQEFLLYLPNILGAVLIGFFGWILATTIRNIISSFLTAVGANQLGTKFGMSAAEKGSLSWLGGTFAYVLFLVITAISVLTKLDIAAVSTPAINMFTQIFTVLPQIITATVIIFIGYLVGKYVGELITNLLTGINFNNLPFWLGLPTQSSELQNNPVNQTPSEIIGIMARIGIILFATVTALDILNLTALTAIAQVIIVIFGSVIVGLLVLAIGLYFANLAFNLIITSGLSQARILAQTARVTIIAFVSTMALQQIGIATDIVNLAFSLSLGAIAVSIALAIGLGTREIAGQLVREWLGKVTGNR
ncbi:TM helix repeat-containing protein [Calothrix parasitica NIES-267]|uniref:TM helix repeat-containing protein n=1 Tax=Calothrix parasitica NIES-267 TaxID=1973488 RepID=A0A1Z4LNJ8_9CYAN|nr:TM helix repeat-containing protein [Calothrix parasitica NIES-267]